MTLLTRNNLRVTPEPIATTIGAWATPKQRDFFRNLDLGLYKSIRKVCITNNINEYPLYCHQGYVVCVPERIHSVSLNSDQSESFI